MTAFTLLGLWVFWCLCWQVGYYGAMALDDKEKLNDLLSPVAYDICLLSLALDAAQSGAGTRGEGNG